MADQSAYEDAIARNLAIWRTARRLTQKSLAARMSALGFGWRQQIVTNVESGQRRVTVGECIGLALALETTVAGIMTPAEPFSSPTGEVVLPSGDVIAADDVEALLYSRNTHAVTWDGDKPVFKSPRRRAADLLASPSVASSPATAERSATGPAATSEAQPVVAAIVTSDLGVLVGKRNDRTPPWTFIAGEQEPGEQPTDTIVREVKEETGLEIEPGEMIGERDHPKTGRHMIYLAGRPVRGTKVIVGDEAELDEVRWLDLDEAGELMPDMFGPVRTYLENAIAGDQ